MTYDRTLLPPARLEFIVLGDTHFIEDTGAYAIDDTALAAARRLRAQHPDAAVWLVRVGHRALHRIGGRPIVGRL